MASELSAILAYFIGTVVMAGYHTIAIILAVLIVILLSSKEYLTRLQEKFSRIELGHSLKFAVISLVALPLLPDEKFSFLSIANWFLG